MERILKATRLVAAIAILLLSSRELRSQGPPPLKNSGLAVIPVGQATERALAVTISESSVGEDLNGDGDTGDSAYGVYDLETCEATLLPIIQSPRGIDGSVASGTRFVFAVSELAQDEDLNGDGDKFDERIVQLHDLETGVTTNLGLDSLRSDINAKWLALSPSEEVVGKVLNFDGDTHDRVVHVYNLESKEMRNLGTEGLPFLLGDRCVFLVHEGFQGRDLNRDGDRGDSVIVSHDLELGRTTNLGLSVYYEGDLDRGFSRRWLAFPVREVGQNEDLNGDADMEDNVLHVHDFESGETRNLRLPVGDAPPLPPIVGTDFAVSEKWLACAVTEYYANQDLNEDGDINDEVVHVYDLETGQTSNLRLADGLPDLIVSGKWLVIQVPEEAQGGKDRNDDMDTDDQVIVVHDLETGETTDLGLTVVQAELAGRWLVVEADGGVLHSVDLETQKTTRLPLNLPWFPRRSRKMPRMLFFPLSESAQETDLNADGDMEDSVVHLHDLETGWTGHVGIAGEFRGALSANWFAVSANESQQGQDLNGDGDQEDSVLHLGHLPCIRDFASGAGGEEPDCNGNGTPDSCDVAYRASADCNENGIPDECELESHDACGRQVPGDCNQDGALDISDAVCTLGVLFLGSPESFPCGDGSPEDPSNLALVDWNADTAIDVSDGIGMLTFLFGGGAAHPLAVAGQETTACVPIPGCPTVCD